MRMTMLLGVAVLGVACGGGGKSDGGTGGGAGGGTGTAGSGGAAGVGGAAGAGGSAGTGGAPAATCTTSTDCSGGKRCALGLCLDACDTGSCAAGTTCARLDGGAFCVTPCTTTCDAGRCEAFWPTRARACINAAAPGPAACASVRDEGDCSFCGVFELGGPTCGGGGRCFADSACVPGGCQCNPGFSAVRCDGGVCDGGVCTGDFNWWCRAAGATNLHRTRGTCVCTDGREVPFRCGSRESCDELCGQGCDQAAPSCPSFAPKCSTVSTDAGPQGRCGAPVGDAGLGQLCRAQGLTDTCAGGLSCDRRVEGPNVCLQPCRGEADCRAGEACLAYSIAPTVGQCVASTCTPAGAGCSAQESCNAFYSLPSGDFRPYCKWDGPFVLAQPCDGNSQCGHNLTCAGLGVCQFMCTTATGCPDGGACTVFAPGLQFGLCAL